MNSAPILGSHPATDFLNSAITPNGQAVEFIGSGGELIDWLVAAGLLDATVSAQVRRRLGEAQLDSAAAQAREFREWARAWIERWRAQPDRRYEREFARLNQMLAQANTYREVEWADGSARVVERTPIESPQQILALLAMSVALLLTEERPELVRQCSGVGCSLCFLDKTKGHRRLFCSAALCGNRAKVAAFRQRQRAA